MTEFCNCENLLLVPAGSPGKIKLVSPLGLPLTSQIPKCISELSRSLVVLNLEGNKFQGTIPLTYPKSCKLKMINLSGNQLEAMPLQYDYSITTANKGNDMQYTKILTVFQVIDFLGNNFTGTIPRCIGELRGLQALNLSNNDLQGEIPPSLVHMTDLESLDLSNNKISEGTPEGLTQLTFLEVFNVSYNFLMGPIPQGRQFGAFDSSSFPGNSRLCGPPPSKRSGMHLSHHHQMLSRKAILMEETPC
ncbi:hypothetical protein Cgig2_004021 [Carnegiea gigantea]|uniref:Uncharacterized protein n=1 Tax=Carnegiea gigantea TaxID=171969 RepID=A0A9Q1QPH1_9CARY|nr:hypothetical protein Cgig2_004021 [Carnegiea gigantea]